MHEQLIMKFNKKVYENYVTVVKHIDKGRGLGAEWKPWYDAPPRVNVFVSDSPQPSTKRAAA